MTLRECCDLCNVAFGNSGRYTGDGGSGVFEVCEACGEKIAQLQLHDPRGAELSALLDRLLLAAAPARGHA